MWDIDDSRWADLCALLLPGIEPSAETAKAYRVQVDEVLAGIAVFGGMARDRAGREVIDFGEAARAGEQFLKGIYAACQFVDAAVNATDVRTDRETSAHEPDPRHTAVIELEIGRLRSIQAWIDDMNRQYGHLVRQTSPAAKPWLHHAVARLRLIWLDAGQVARPKQDFLGFAYAVVGGNGPSVTDNSVLESFDRHSNRLLAQMLRRRAALQSGPGAGI